MGQEDVTRWRAEAEAIDASKVPSGFPYPFHVILGESAEVAGFCERHYRAVRKSDGTVGIPGLELAACPGKPELHEKCGEDLQSLARAASEANWQYRRSIRSEGAPFDAGMELLRDMRSTYTWFFDDGVEEAADTELQNLLDAHETEPTANDELAHALDDHAAFGEGVSTRLQEMQGFDPTVLERARETAKKLRGRSSAPVVLSAESRSLLDLRNRFTFMLLARMNLVRGAARFVFRSNPERIREVTSAYERRRRLAHRKRQEENPGDPPPPAPAGPAPQS